MAAGSGDPDMDVRPVREMAEYLRHASQVVPRRVAVEELLARMGDGRQGWVQPGWCRFCERAVGFYCDWSYSDGRTPNFRERLECPSCRLNNRQRFVGALVRNLAALRPPGSRRFYLYEQVTPFHQLLAGSLEAEVIGSEYLGHEYRGGETVEGVRHEDALALSFGDGEIDCIVSQDVYEHVPDIDMALFEAARVLAPDGKLVFSIPFHVDRETTRQRARLDDGEVVNLLEPEFHGNPLSPEGSLVFWDIGWDLFERCRAAGFRDAYMLLYYGLAYGHLGGGMQGLFVAER